MSIEMCFRFSVVDDAQEIFEEDVGLEVCNRAGFGARQICSVADDEDVLGVLGAEGLLVRRNEVQLVSESAAGDDLVSHVRRDSYEDIERDFPLIPRYDHLALVIDSSDAECVRLLAVRFG